jgi:uncharacterized iron-regulated membrane protein
MKTLFRSSMAWLHTWVGLLLGWVLYFMFITGTTGYLDTEIDRWMKPELPAAVREGDLLALSRLSETSLKRLAPQRAQEWWIQFPINRNMPHLTIGWELPGQEWHELVIDTQTGSPLKPRETAGGQTLYRMHWQLHYVPQLAGEWIVGVATMFMFVALITGVIVHKKIFADFFTFRPGKGQRSWLDAHNVVSVVTLPFQLMITWSGLIFLMLTYMPLIIAAWYGTGEAGRKAFRDEVFRPPAATERSGQPAHMVALDTVVAQAQARWHGAAIASLNIQHPNDASARVVVRSDYAAGPLRSSELLVFDGVSGALLAEQPALHSPAKGFRDVMLGLHEGLFAGPVLRALYVLSGLMGAAMIATGLVLWSVKRRQRIETARTKPHLGLRLVEKLNVATIIGLPVAIAAYFWANRLLPVETVGRADWEVHVLFLVWLAMFVHAAVRPAGRIWREQCALAALAFGLLPLLNALTTDRHLLASLPAGDWVFAGFDLTMLALGGVFATLSWRMALRARTVDAVPMGSQRSARQVPETVERDL